MINRLRSGLPAGLEELATLGSRNLLNYRIRSLLQPASPGLAHVKSRWEGLRCPGAGLFGWSPVPEVALDRH